jgi:recombination protein RecA
MDKMLAELRKKHGEAAVMFLGDRPLEPVAVIRTGSIGLDLALGVGGYPRGRIIEIYGPEASGKTTLALHAIQQRLGQGFNNAAVTLLSAPAVLAKVEVEVRKKIAL